MDTVTQQQREAIRAKLEREGLLTPKESKEQPMWREEEAEGQMKNNKMWGVRAPSATQVSSRQIAWGADAPPAEEEADNLKGKRGSVKRPWRCLASPIFSYDLHVNSRYKEK